MNLTTTGLVTLATAAFGVASLAQAGDGCTYSKQQASCYISADLEATSTIVDVAKASKSPSFQTLVKLVAAADLAEALSSGEFTVFAPTDEAFAKLPDGTAETLLAEEGRATLKTILTYHVVPSKILSKDIPEGTTEVETLAGQMLTVVRDGDSIMVNGKKVAAADVMASNGVIHVLSDVLMPKS